MVKQYRINIDGKEITALPGQTILEAARENDIYIPSLCYDERMEVYGACGICVVEVEGKQPGPVFEEPIRFPAPPMMVAAVVT